MNNRITIIVMNVKQLLLLGLVVAFSAQASKSYAQASDAPGLPYHVPAIMNIISDAIEQPTDTNAYVGMLFNSPYFPAFEQGMALDEATYNAIQSWVISNVEIIQDFQKERKRNYDKYYLNQ